MATITPVSELPMIKREGSARVSEPIVEEFLASNASVARVDEIGAKAQSTKATLKRFVETRKLPVDVVVREGAVYLQRTDLDGDGSE